MVRRRRSMSAGLQHAELVGVDWELPSSIGLTRRRRKPWQSSGTTRRRSGWSLAMARGLAGARVLVPVRKLEEEEGIEILGLIHGGGSLFIDALGRRLSSSTSRRRRRIGRCPALHRAVCLLEVEDDDGSKRYRGWAAELGIGPA
jgi:hypothetical protein